MRISDWSSDVCSSDLYSEAEWTARQELAACYRIFAMMGWDEMIFNHVTVKVPDEDGSYLINPYGMHFSEVTASSLIKLDIDGNKEIGRASCRESGVSTGRIRWSA